MLAQKSRKLKKVIKTGHRIQNSGDRILGIRLLGDQGVVIRFSGNPGIPEA